MGALPWNMHQCFPPFQDTSCFAFMKYISEVELLDQTNLGISVVAWPNNSSTWA